MRRQIIFILLIILTQVAFGQKNNLAKTPPPPSAKNEREIEEKNHNCSKKSFTSFSARLKNYPFNVSAQIQFVSFEGGIYLINNKTVRKDSLPRINDSILYAQLTEVKTLTYPQVDKLTDIIYDYGFAGKTSTVIETGCYNPRNAILFLDMHNKVIAFIEICFQCGKAYGSSDNISLGEMCEQKLDMLYDLFKKVGVEYGITKGVVPGEKE